jgi:iron-sulfur cluster assembly accessory protein
MKSTEDYLKDLDNFFDNLPESKSTSLEKKVLEDFHGNPPILNNKMHGKLPTITEAAKSYIAKNMSQGDCFKFSVSGGGCSGFNYEFEVVDSTQFATPDHVFLLTYPLAIVDRESLPFVYGATIDIKVTGLTTAFIVNNPGAKASCGCGTSFAFNEALLE